MIREINLCKKNDRLFENTATFLTPKIIPVVLSFDQLNILANNYIPDPCNGCLEAHDVGLYNLYKDIYELQELGIQMEKAKNVLLRTRSDWQKKLNEIDTKYKGPGNTSIFLCGISAKHH